MAIKISELGNLTSFSDTTLLPVVDTANAYITVKSTGSTLKNYIFSNVGNIVALGNITTANSYVNAAYFTGDGSALTGINTYSNIKVATYLPAHTSNIGGTLSNTAQPYVTSLGTLTTLDVSGITNIDTLLANIVAPNLYSEGINFVNVANTWTYNLSNTVTNNILIIFTSDPTATLNMPQSPFDGQVTNISANANVILSVGTGNVSPSFSGANLLVNPLRYIYSQQYSTWFRT